jgi:hypothetical protein
LIYNVGQTLSGVSSNDVDKLKAELIAKRQSQLKTQEELSSKCIDIIAVHVGKNATGRSSPESIAIVEPHRLDVQHPVSLPDGVKCVTLQVQSGGRSCAMLLIPESLMFLGATHAGFAVRLIDKIAEGLVESGKQRSTVNLVSKHRQYVGPRSVTPRSSDQVSPVYFTRK